jgi:hypothetical protein
MCCRDIDLQNNVHSTRVEVASSSFLDGTFSFQQLSETTAWHYLIGNYRYQQMNSGYPEHEALTRPSDTFNTTRPAVMPTTHPKMQDGQAVSLGQRHEAPRTDVANYTWSVDSIDPDHGSR